ncbi:MAG TPA: magnesium transporter [Polyangia bacterium]|nr:magnesium transporter [Polyangia bacterium]
MRLSTLLAPDLAETLRTSPDQAIELAEELHAVDLADLILGISDEQAAPFVAALPLDKAAGAFDAMTLDRRVQLFGKLERSLAARIADAMSADERADLFKELPDEVRSDLLARMPKDAQTDVRELIRYPETSAGGLMTTDYVAVDIAHTVERAIDQVRSTAEQMETIYEAYAVDPNGTLLGVVSLRDLVLARAGQPIAAVMNPDVISVPPEMDQEDVAHLFEHYDMLALPVVDATRKMLGIVTVDDVVKVLKQEQAEDIQKMGAVAPTEEPYFQTDFWTMVKKRAGWLIAIFLGEILTASVLEHYEAARRAFQAIEVFVPLIISSGGNTGSQASSLVIRGLALEEFSPGDAIKILWRELRTGLVLGCILGCIGLLRATLVGHSGGHGMSAAVGLSLIACVTFGSVAGSGLPLLIKRLGFDPAVSSGPFIASLVDVLGIIIYMNIAIWILG